MQLTRYTDYSLRVLIFLSLQEDGQLITITKISEHFDIPRNHLVKVVHKLGMLKFIHTTRGKNGGIRLGQSAAMIRIGDVIRKMESSLEIVHCDAPSPCPIKPNCTLKGILRQATEAFLEVLDQYTIADLQQSPDYLRTLLQIPSAKIDKVHSPMPD